MPRNRVQIDLVGPLLREHEGAQLTERSFTGRLAEIIERMDRVVETAMPDLTPTQWGFILWAAWDAIEMERVLARGQPASHRDVDGMAWMQIVAAAAEKTEPWAKGLARRLHAMTPIERIAVLERIEAYGRAEAMTHG